MASNSFTAEVIDTSMAYKDTVDVNNVILPKGSIKVRGNPSSGLGGRTIDIIAAPVNTFDYVIPNVGEHVLIIAGTSTNSNNGRQSAVYYYDKPINVKDNVSDNSLKGTSNVTSNNTSDQMLSTGLRNRDATERNNTEIERITIEPSNISFLQPYEGDRILQSRFGSSMRFTSTIKGGAKSYAKLPTWDGPKNGSPLVVISSGIADISSDPSKYAIEEINADKSSIYLTSDQNIKLLPAQQLNASITNISDYTNSQVIINADRLIFNSKSDSIVLASFKTVAVSTPDWKIDMNNFFNLVFEFIDEVRKIANKEETIATGTGPTGLATNVTKFTEIYNKINDMKSVPASPVTAPKPRIVNEITVEQIDNNTVPVENTTTSTTSTGLGGL